MEVFGSPSDCNEYLQNNSCLNLVLQSPKLENKKLRLKC